MMQYKMTLIITKAIKDYYDPKFNYNDINIIMSLIKKYQQKLLNTILIHLVLL